MQHTPEQILEKAKERGYEIVMHASDRSMYSMYKESKYLNLKLYPSTGEFELNHMKGFVRITTDKCGSFMNDDHFRRIERAIRKIVFDLTY